ncbi:protein of unknown function DUF6 transmembrane [Sulfobacillus acidophilus TPY]|nr:protein of unknown function DUF6 transmembrane [Sulfobacillus acidophilus TPY]
MTMVLIAATSYGLVTPLVKWASLQGIDISWLTVGQYPIPLLGFWLGSRLHRERPLTRSERRWTVLVGGAGSLTALTYYQALKWLSGPVAITLLFQFTWMLPVISRIFGGSPLRRREIGAIAAIIAGTVLQILQLPNRWPLIGTGLGLLAGLSYAVALYGSSRFSESAPLWRRAFESTLFGAFLIIVGYRGWTFMGHMTRGWIWGSLIGLFSQFIPMLLIYRATPRLSHAATAILASFELPVAVVVSWLGLKEPVPLVEWLGIGIMMVGIVAGSWPSEA